MVFDASNVIRSNFTNGVNPFSAAISIWKSADDVINAYKSWLDTQKRNDTVITEETDTAQDFIRFLESQTRTAQISLTTTDTNLADADGITGDEKYVLAASPTGTVVPGTAKDTVLGTVAFVHHSRTGANPDSVVRWHIVRTPNGLFEARKLKDNPSPFGGDPYEEASTIRAANAEKLIGEMRTLIPEDSKSEYSLELYNDKGMRIKNLEVEGQKLEAQMCDIEKSTINWEKKQRKMQERQWKLQLYQAILDALQSGGKLFGIKMF